MPTLTEYTTATRALLHDPTGSLYGALTSYINEARTRLALQSECVRFLWSYDGTLQTQQNATSGYTAGVSTITLAGVTGVSVGMLVFPLVAPVTDFQTNTYVTAINGNDITINAPPLVTDLAVLTLNFWPPLSTVPGLETYRYGTNVRTAMGIQDVIQVKGVAVNWGGVSGSSLVTLEQWSFTKYQAFLGYYGVNLGGNPAVWCSYQNTVKMRPVPSSVWPMQLDTVCTPIALASDTDVEAIPYPYTDSVKYYAAYLALMNSQRPQDADRMEALYNKTMNEARSFTQRTFVPYIYR